MTRARVAAFRAAGWGGLVALVLPLEDKVDDQGRPYTLFNCCEHDPVTKRCGIYTRRPVACRTYPRYSGERTCTHCGFRASRYRLETKRRIREEILRRRRATLGAP